MFRRIVFASVLTAMLCTGVVFANELDPALPPYHAASGVFGAIKAAGSDTLNNLMALWTEGFRSKYPGVTTAVEAKGSSTAVPALIESLAQFGPMSRKMKPKEIDAFERKFGYKPSVVRVAVDALAIFVHKDNPVGCLTLQQLDAVFSSTRKGGAPRDRSRSGENWGSLENGRTCLSPCTVVTRLQGLMVFLKRLPCLAGISKTALRNSQDRPQWCRVKPLASTQ